MVAFLTRELKFPHPLTADSQGLLAIGGDLSPERVLLAYTQGIFPWFDEFESPPLWFAPRKRMVMRPCDIRVTHSMAKGLRQGRFQIRYDCDFAGVLKGCAETPRPGQDGTWLGPSLQQTMLELHRQGYAHSAEAWADGELVGGLYGIAFGGVLCGDSMFSRRSNASKLAFATLCRALDELGFALIDCQVYTDHLSSLGAYEVSSRAFLNRLAEAKALRPKRPWPENA